MAFHLSFQKKNMVGVGDRLKGDNDRRKRAHLDIPLILITYALVIFGIYSIAVATFNPDKGTDLSVLNYILNSSYSSSQLLFALVSALEMGVIIAVPYELIRSRCGIAYSAVVALLVFALGAESIAGINAFIPIGSGRTIQPAEFIKIGIILMLARTLADDTPFSSVQNGMRILIIFGLPALLTLAEGETGSVLVMGVIFFVMILFSNAKAIWPLSILTLAIAGLGTIFGYALLSGSTDYRLMRLLSFLDPQAYYNSAGYQILQSQMAIGSGGTLGIGTFVPGSLSQLNYVPEDWTDFIFATIGEAFGFVGCLALILTYLLLLMRLIYLARNTTDDFGRLVIYGVAGMMFAHIAENIGMTLGCMPITGIPLPFVSYGGSSLITNIAGISIVLNVVRNRSSASVNNSAGKYNKRKKKQRIKKKDAIMPTV